MHTTLSQSVMHISFTRESAREVALRRMTLIAVAVFAMAYIYLASASVFHAIVEQKTERMIGEKRTALAALEQEYFLLSKDVSVGAASALGLSKVYDKSFVTREVHVGSAHSASGL